MKILVVGRGGREHAMVWALAQSMDAEVIYCAPGNAGIAQIAECVPIEETDFDALIQLVKEKGIGLTVVGPEDALAAGIVDRFQAEGLKIFGPDQKAAEIESSKTFAKDLMKRYGIPTAAYETFTEPDAAWDYVQKQGAPIVIKGDGLAAGKGVVVAQTLEEAKQAIDDMMRSRVFGNAGSRVVIEEFLTGQELSILSFVDGEVVRPMVAAQDHKPVYDGDRGPNTGGMGTYSPVPQMPDADVERSVQEIILPTAKAMVQEGRPFRGILYAGLMMTPDGPKVIEFNARFGDPETQVVLPRLNSDLLNIFKATVDGKLADVPIQWSEDAAVCVIAASGGYPGSYTKGFPISGLTEVAHVLVFHAGTARDGDDIVTNGGRVLGVTCKGANIAEARERAYEAMKHISWEGMHYRTDIAAKALEGDK
jgi:phosphoribosylamine--glycine ligase